MFTLRKTKMYKKKNWDRGKVFTIGGVHTFGVFTSRGFTVYIYIYIYIYMVSGTLNNSNFYSFKSYWIFGILGIFSNFETVLDI